MKEFTDLIVFKMHMQRWERFRLKHQNLHLKLQIKNKYTCRRYLSKQLGKFSIKVLTI